MRKDNRVFKPDFTLSKRQLGLLGIAGGALAVVGVLLYDQLGFSDPQGGFGASQFLALGGAVVAVLIGITLLPLGDDPA